MASTYGIIGRVGVLVEPSFDGAQKKVRDGLGKPLAQEAPKQGVDLGNAIVNGTTRAFKWGGLAAGAALGTAITKGFGRLRAMEDATAKIEGLGYSAKEVDQIMTDVQGGLDGTMFLYSEGADVAAGALAAGVEQGEELESYLRLTADAATQAGIDFGSMGQMMNRVNSSGKLTGDVLNQLEENGVYVGAAIADSLGVTQEEFRKMVSQGEVSADEFNKVMNEQFAGSSEKAAETMTGAMSLAWTGIGQLGEKLIQNAYPYLRDFFQGFYDWVQDISPKVEEFGERVGEAIGNIIGWLQDNPGTIKVFAAAITSLMAAMVGYTAYVKAAAAATTVWNTVQKLLNGTMKLNPIGLWVAAIAALVTGLIWAYNNVDWFRDAVQTAWDAITTAFTWAWENVIQPVIGWIGDAWNWLADVFVQAWENYLSPVFEGIGTVVTWLWENIISPYIGFVIGLWMSLGEVFMWVWENVLSPVFSWFGDIAVWVWENVLSHVFAWIGDRWSQMVDGMSWVWENILAPVFSAIGAAAVWLWENALQPTFSWIGEHWSSVMDIMKWAWDYILKPVWDAIVAVALWLWEYVLEPVFTWIGDHWDAIVLGMKLAWEEILKPAWDRLVEIALWLWNDILEPVFRWIGDKWSDMSDLISGVYDDYIKPMFDAFGDTVEWLGETFDRIVEAIGDEWERLKELVATPINFVIDTIYNDGIRDLFNKMADTFGLPDSWRLPRMDTVEWATGGYTGAGHKYQPAGIVHAGEFVLQQTATNKLMRRFGLSGLDHMNATGELPGHADGGMVQPVRGPMTSAYGPRGGGFHAGMDWAVPVGTPVLSALAGTVARAGWNILSGRTGLGMLLNHPGNRQTYYGHLSGLIASVGDQVEKGAAIALSGNTGRSTGPHLHFETLSGGSPVDPVAALGGNFSSSEGGGAGWFDPAGAIKDFIGGIISTITGQFPGNDFVEMTGEGLTNIASEGVDKAIELGKTALDWMTPGGPTRTIQHASDVAAVQEVANRYGWGSGNQWDAIKELVQRESSWDKTAKNPTSSAEGLFQKMTSLHGPVHPEASGQAEWGLNYIFGRYGTPAAALRFHDRNNYYADGGFVNPLFRDQGGKLPPGLSMVLNNTGQNEAILNSRQWADIHTLAARGSGGSGVTINGDVWAHSPEQVAQEIHRDARRAAALAPVL